MICEEHTEGLSVLVESRETLSTLVASLSDSSAGAIVTALSTTVAPCQRKTNFTSALSELGTDIICKDGFIQHNSETTLDSDSITENLFTNVPKMTRTGV